MASRSWGAKNFWRFGTWRWQGCHPDARTTITLRR